MRQTPDRDPAHVVTPEVTVDLSAAERVDALNWLGQPVKYSRRIPGVEELARAAWDLNTAHPDQDEAVFVGLLHALAVLSDALGANCEAEALHRRAVTRALQLPSGGDLGRLKVAALEGLAINLRGQERFEEAEGVFRGALDIASETMGAGSWVEVNLLRHLGLLYQHFGRKAETEKVYRQALALVEESFGPGHPDAVLLRHNIAVLCDLTGRSDEARCLWAQARADLEKEQEETPGRALSGP